MDAARLRSLADAFPVPGAWHPYAAEIGAIAADLRRLAAGPELTAEEAAAASARLGGMIDPEGRHPFVDEIVETLAAMREALDTLRP